MTEDQVIDFIISKIDMHLVEQKDVPLDEALMKICKDNLSEKEINIFFSYFFRLYKGYNKYKHINLAIEYHNILETIVTNKASDTKAQHSINTLKGKTLDNILSPSSDTEDLNVITEINSIEHINRTELVKLRTFFFKIIVTVFVFGGFFYVALIMMLDRDAIGVLTTINKFLQ